MPGGEAPDTWGQGGFLVEMPTRPQLNHGELRPGDPRATTSPSISMIPDQGLHPQTTVLYDPCTLTP